MKKKRQSGNPTSEKGGPNTVRKPRPRAGRIAFPEDWLSQHNIDPGKCSLVPVDGTGMEPTLEDKGLIMIDHQRTRLVDGCIYMARIDKEYVVGRASKLDEKWRLVRDAPGSKNLDLSPDAEVLGQVVWAGKTLLRDEPQFVTIPYLTAEQLEK